MRERTICQMRVRNEERWIRRSLERTWQVCQTAVIFDDGSDDSTEEEAVKSFTFDSQALQDGDVTVYSGSVDRGPCELHYIHSPFTKAIRPKERVNENRDKNVLNSYCKSVIDYDYVLCLDGDEMLSKSAVRQFPDVWNFLDNNCDIVVLTFVYLWDAENLRRVDGVYGPLSGISQLRFPRVYTIKRLEEHDLFNLSFAWEGVRGGGFHCGSIPMQNFTTPLSGLARTIDAPIVHFGYIDETLRQRKYIWYNHIDPNNEHEGCYKHIIGQPDQWAPGPVDLQPWEDA